jgi:uncharacterized protein YjdB
MKWNARYRALLVLCLSAAPAVCGQQAVTVEWDPNAEPGVVGYRVYSGTGSRDYDTFVEVTNFARATIQLPQHGERYYFAVTAFDAAGLESPFSEELSVITAQLPEEGTQTIRLSGSSTNNSSFTLLAGPAHGDLTGVAPDVSYSPDQHYSGRDRFDFAELASGQSNTLAVLLNVLPVNDRPTLNTIANVAIASNSGSHVVPLTGITGGPTNESQAVTITATSSAPSVVPHPTVNYTSPGSQGTLTLTPAPGAVGTATIVVTVNDGGSENSTATRTFTVTVSGPPPATIGNVSMLGRDARTLVIGFATDRPAAGAIEFGLTPGFGATTGLGAVGTNHAITLTNLVPGTNYYLRPRAIDQASNAIVGETMTSETAPAIVEMWSAESGTLASPMTVGTNESALGGYYVVSMTENSGAATFPLQLPAFSSYYLWARVQSESSNAWMFASADELSSVLFDGGGSGDGLWRWVALRDSNSVWAPLLDASVHQFAFSNVTAGVQLDELIYSTDPLWRPGIHGSPPVLTANRAATGVELAWMDSIEDEAGFAIEVSTNGTDFVPLVTVPGGTTNYVHVDVDAVAYFYRVYAFNESDRTSFSNVASVDAPEIPAIPAAPEMVSALVKGRMKVRIEWRDNSTNETGFVIERSLDGIAFEPVLTTPANTTLARDSIDNSGTYYYRARAFNEVGSSPPSDATSVEVRRLAKTLLPGILEKQVVRD